jgi:hypothetical protein
VARYPKAGHANLGGMFSYLVLCRIEGRFHDKRCDGRFSFDVIVATPLDLSQILPHVQLEFTMLASL